MKKGRTEMREEYDFSQAKRGAIVPPSPNKTRITIRIDTDTLNWFREQVNTKGGGSYQTRINHALREFIANQQESWEVTLRRVIRGGIGVGENPQGGEKGSLIKCSSLMTQAN